MFQFLSAHMPLRSLRWLESKAICFCQSPSLRKNVNHLLVVVGGGGGVGMRVESEMSWLEKIWEFVAGAAMLDKGPDWSQGVRSNGKSLLRGPSREESRSLSGEVKAIPLASHVESRERIHRVWLSWAEQRSDHNVPTLNWIFLSKGYNLSLIIKPYKVVFLGES